MMNIREVARGLTLPEGPRWHDGALWFSDMHAQTVRVINADGAARLTIAVPDACSGLGFFSNGDVAIAAMHSRRVLRWHADSNTLSEWADLSDLATWHVNDLVVTADDHIFVGNFGDHTAPPAPCRPADLVVIDPTGRPAVAAPALHFANGMIALPNRLIVAETRATPPRLTSFRRMGEKLLDRTVLIEFDAARMPDGIAFDGESIWVASPFTSEVLRVSPVGELLATFAVPQMPFAVAANDQTVFVCVADDWRPEVAKASRSGRIIAFDRP